MPVMHPDFLPTPTRAQRLLGLATQVLLSPLFRLVWTLVLLAVVSWGLLRFFPSVGRLSNVSLAGAFKNALVLTAVLWASVRVLEGKGLSAVGMGPRGAPLRFAQGYFLGAALLSAVTAGLWLAGSYRVVGFGTGATARALAGAALSCVFIGVFDEVLARGLMFRLTEEAQGSWAALALSAFLFGFGHAYNPGATRLSSVAIALEAGVLLGAAYVATRSLWVPIGLHAAWNFFEGPVYGARVSGMSLPSLLQADFPGPAWLTGGDFGPEAGVVAVGLGTALGIAFLILAARRGQLFTPAWLRRLLRRPALQPLNTQALPEAPSPP